MTSPSPRMEAARDDASTLSNHSNAGLGAAGATNLLQTNGPFKPHAPASPSHMSMRSTGSMASDRSHTTRRRIEEVMDTFKSFDTDMKIGTRQRREKDEFKLHSMREQLALLDKNLAAEVKYRQEMTKSIQSWVYEEIEKLKEHCSKLRESKYDALDRKFVAIQARIEDMEVRFAKDMASLPVAIEEKGAKLAEVLRDTIAAFDAEKSSRVDRETQITNTLADHEGLVGQTFEEHRNERMHAIDDLRAILEKCIRSHMKVEEKLMAAFHEEIAAIKNQVVLESQERERHDLELAGALNRYIAKLQSSLHIVNSTDT